ncbi:MAG: TetR/AcrR family transcriptional regulator [Pseudomonadota bacterium]
MNDMRPLRRGDLRDALVAYARQEADAGHIDQMSLRAAARDLGVSSGAVYRHFADKDALLKAVAHQGFDELRERFFRIRGENMRASCPIEAVARAFRMGRAFVDYAYENPTLWRMMFGRIGLLCREDHNTDPEMTRYTMLDCSAENCRDLHEMGGLAQPPEIEDIRFVWSAIHGAADLAQSGMRLDGSGRTVVADQTTERSLRALGCPQKLIEKGRQLLETSS